MVTDPVQPSRRAHLSDEVATYLRTAITSGEYGAGDFIRIDRVAEDLDISATPVREALLVLRAEGFVELRPNRGFEVLAISPDDVRDLFCAQAYLYGEVAARAAVLATEGDVALLTGRFEELAGAAAGPDFPALFRASYRFTREVSSLGRAAKLNLLFRIAAQYVPRGEFQRMGMAVPEWRETELASGAAILDAVRSHDPDRSRRESSAYVLAVGELMVRHMAGAGPGGPARRLTPG